jgi:hypothetical protein
MAETIGDLSARRAILDFRLPEVIIAPMAGTDRELTESEKAALSSVPAITLLRAAHGAMKSAATTDEDKLYADEVLDVLRRYAGDHVEP